MARRFRFRRGPRMNFGRARRVVRAVTGITLAKRIQVTRATIPDVTSVDFDNPLAVELLECTESMDEEVESDGTGIADVPLYSRVKSMRLQGIFEGSTSVSTMVRWLLYKKPDGEALVTDLTNSIFHSSNDTPGMREIRKYTVAKGMLVINPSSAVAHSRFFVSPKAWARISPMRENDKLSLIVAKAAEGTTCSLSLLGTIYVKANA